MAVLFLSHSSKDDVAANAIETWLHDHGFTDLFVDHSAIGGGEKWARALREASGACRVVICLVTENWLDSAECFGEFKAAWYMGKRVIPLLALPPGAAPSVGRLADVLAEDQGFDLGACLNGEGRLDLARDKDMEGRLVSSLRAGGALTKVGLDPEAFAIDRKLRPTPFPGLASFGDDDADAALFYGRNRELSDTLEELRKVRAERDLRPFVILGASGAGKSSLLRAGIIPRLRREAPAWVPLRAFRPGADPLLNLAEALAQTLADFGMTLAHGVIRDRLFDAWSRAEREGGRLTPAGVATIAASLEDEGRKLRALAGRPGATILISVDQAEELALAESDSAEALADYLHVALNATESLWQLIFTIRTDSFPDLQRQRYFQDLKARGYDLRAIPAFRIDRVIEEPAKRYGVKIDVMLVDALMEDAPEEDALPLLAFALQRLWRQYAVSGQLTFDNYHKIGGLKGLVEDAAERAVRGIGPDEDVALPPGPPTKTRVDLAASTFVPALAQINDRGATIRRIAAWSSFTDDQQELLIKFDRWRLVVRKGDAQGGTVEVAHEALFREWTRLQSWLEPERMRLEALRSLQTDALTWDRSDRDAAFLNHREKRLAEAEALGAIGAYRMRLNAADFDYLAACRQAGAKAKRRELRVQALIYGLLIGVIVGLVGWINQAPLKEQMNWFMTMRPYMLANFRPYVLTAEAEQALKPGVNFRECAADCPEMIVVPAGKFTMGSPATEEGRFDVEGPQHEVTIAKAFAVSKFDVTFAYWDACVSVGGCPAVSDAGMGRAAKPVINVSWEDARKYVAWLSEMSGKPYRLLTEAEWEYAARAGTTSAYIWGADVGFENTNCDTCGSKWDDKETSPVGSFAANSFGLYDMVGDAWQWLEDCHHASYVGAPLDGSAWTSGDCTSRVIRGGSWLNPPRLLRTGNRYRYGPDFRASDLGFRVGRTITP
jgi:formylglycine-generating enzyme required for sulfatase activity